MRQAAIGEFTKLLSPVDVCSATPASASIRLHMAFLPSSGENGVVSSSSALGVTHSISLELNKRSLSLSWIGVGEAEPQTSNREPNGSGS